jgi:serine/threonine-protein kinase RsbW
MVRHAAESCDGAATGLAAMGQIRVAMAALAPSHRSPAGLIDELERFTTGVDGASMATVAYAIIEPTTGRTRFAAAGHPPPLLIDPKGRASYLWQGRSRPIGAAIAAGRSDSTLQVRAGSTLVLYTDGLVERRGEVIDRGLDRLLVAAEEAARGGTYDIRDHIADELLSGPGDDDVAMLVIRLFDGAPCYRRQLRGRAPSSRLRDEMGTWLQAHGVDASTRDDIVLASWEAIANAMEHGSLGDAEGEGEVTMSVRDGTVETEVVDRGQWRGEPSAPPRGKGLVLMRGLVDEVRVEPGDSGTRVVLRRTLDRAAPAVEVPTHG